MENYQLFFIKQRNTEKRGREKWKKMRRCEKKKVDMSEINRDMSTFIFCLAWKSLLYFAYSIRCRASCECP